MTVQTSAGVTYATVAQEPATYDEVGFAALSYINVGEVVDMGEYGPTFEVVTHNPLDKRTTVKKKGTSNSGTLAMQLGRDITNAGQTLLKDGVDGTQIDTVYSHEVTFQDGSIQYFTGQIYSYTTNIGSVNQITGSTVNVELDNTIIEVDAP